MKIAYLIIFFSTIVPISTLYGAEVEERPIIDQLVDAIETQQEGQVTSLIDALKKGGGNLNTPDNRGKYPVHQAVDTSNITIIDLLIRNGADVNLPDAQGVSPLHWASLMGYLDVVKKLIDSGANVNVQDEEGNSPLFLAALRQNKDVAKMLIQQGADLLAKNIRLLTPFSLLQSRNLKLANELRELYNQVQSALTQQLFSAIENEDLDEVNKAFQQGANVNARGKHQNTPLHAASQKANLPLVKLLLENGAQVNAHNENGISPLHNAAFVGSLEIIDALINKGADIDAQDDDNATALHTAIQQGHEDVVTKLIKYNAKVNIPGWRGFTPLHTVAISRQAPSVVKDIASALILAGAHLYIKNDRGETPLKYFELRYPQLVDELIKIYSDLQFELAKQLFKAIEEDNEEEVKSAIAGGVDINLRDSEWDTPLHLATRQGNLNIVRLLIQNNAEVNALNEGNTSPLHNAAFLGDPDIINELLDHNADTTLQDKAGALALHIASLVGNKNAVEILLDRGDRNQVHTPEGTGFIPLHYAVMNRNYDIAKEIASMLIRAGANLEALNNEAKTPLDIGKEKHGEKLAQELKKIQEEIPEEEEFFKFTGDPLKRELVDRKQFLNKQEKLLIPELPALLKLYYEGPQEKEGKEIKERKDNNEQ